MQAKWTVRHWLTRFGTLVTLRVCLWRTGGQGGTKFPLQATGLREQIVSLWLTKDLLALTGVFEKLLGLMEKKIGSEGDLFFT